MTESNTLKQTPLAHAGLVALDHCLWQGPVGVRVLRWRCRLTPEAASAGGSGNVQNDMMRLFRIERCHCTLGGTALQSELQINEITDMRAQDLHALSALLIATVADGASLGFLPPLSPEDARRYWNGVLASDVKLWIAQYHDKTIGTVQLHLCTRQNGTHRAEIAKLMVHPQSRRMGIGRHLMTVAQQMAMQENRSLLVLDTRAGDPSNDLYRSLGYLEAGRIPQYAQSANGHLDETVFYYKLLRQQS